MSELDWRQEKRQKKAESVISLDKQDNNLNPNNKSVGYLMRGLLIFTTQLSVFIIPFAVSTDAGIVTNMITITVLMVMSTYSISSFRAVNPHMDESNRDIIKKEMQGGWRSILRYSIFVQYVVYGLLMIIISTEIVCFIAVDRSTEIIPYLISVGGISMLMLIVLLLRIENMIFALSRLTPLINISFAFYLIVISILYYVDNLTKITIGWDSV